MKILHSKYGWIHKITPEEIQDIRDWLPSEEAARKYFEELYTKEEMAFLTSINGH